MPPTNEDDAWDKLPQHLTNFQLTSFAEALAVTPSPENPNIYISDVKRDWCIGLVPHGGYLASLLTHTASTYFRDQQAKLNQPDLVNLHIEFLTRTSIGPAKILITPLKLGAQFSNIRVQLLQPDAKTSKERVCIEALVTQGNLTKESANGLLSLPTRPLIEEGTFPSRGYFKEQERDEKLQKRRPAAFKTHVLLPSKEVALGLSFRQQWVSWLPVTGQKFTVSSLPFLADAFLPIPENYGLKGNWYPTLSYGVDVKRRKNDGAGKEEGWEWLYVRAEMTEMRHGRFGIDVVIFEESGEVVCTSRHVALIVSAARNIKGRAEAKI